MGDDGVAMIYLDSKDSKVNSLNEEVMTEMQSIFKDVQAKPEIKSAVLISKKPGCFIAGADIKMLEKVKSAEEGGTLSKACQDFLNEVENSSKPVVAAIQGSCLGGGLETAMACHYRIAVDGMKTGLGVPEVMLGLLPGGGGTQRLPKLTGLPNTLDMALTGKTKKAKSVGLVDMVVDSLGPGLQPADVTTLNYLESVAKQIARDLGNGTMKLPDRKPKNLMKKIEAYAMGITQVKDYVFK